MYIISRCIVLFQYPNKFRFVSLLCNRVTLLKKGKVLVTEPISKTNHNSEYTFMTIPEIGSKSPYLTRLLSLQKRDACLFFSAAVRQLFLFCFVCRRLRNTSDGEILRRNLFRNTYTVSSYLRKYLYTNQNLSAAHTARSNYSRFRCRR